MDYFDDIRFIGGAVMPGCQAVINQRFEGVYSIEFMLAGRLAYGLDGAEPVIHEHPIAFWHHPRHCYQYGAVDGRGWDHHWVQISGPRARRLIEHALMPLARDCFIAVPAPQVLAHEFRELVDILDMHDPRRHPAAVARLEHIAALITEWGRWPQDAIHRHPGIEALASDMRRRPETDRNSADDARRLNLSESHFRRLFRRQIGQAPTEFLLSCRMQQAAHHLQAPAARVKTVAAGLGYDDAAQFSKLFKKKIGVAPSHYRRSMLTA
jgi:AraC-like DNA-binding protein